MAALFTVLFTKLLASRFPAIPWFDWYYSIIPPFHLWSRQWGNCPWGSFLPAAFLEWPVTNSTIHKAVGLIVAGRSMILPGTIPSFHHSIPEAVNGTSSWNRPLRSFQPPAKWWMAALWIALNSTIHKAIGLTFPSLSMICLVLFHHYTVPTMKLSMGEQPLGVIPAAGIFGNGR